MNNQNTFCAVFRGVMDVVDIPLQKTAPSDTWAILAAVEMTVAGVMRGVVGETLFDTWDWSRDTIRSEPDPDHPNLNRFLMEVPCTTVL